MMSDHAFRYGCANGVVRFAAFDVRHADGSWLDAEATRQILTEADVPSVPFLGVVPVDFDTVCGLAEGPSMMPGTNYVREGCVVKPPVERWGETVGGVCLKVVGVGYLEKS